MMGPSDGMMMGPGLCAGLCHFVLGDMRQVSTPL